MTLKNRFLAPALLAALGGLPPAGPATAGVIAGTGAAPSSTRLGMTDAVAFKVAEDGPGHALVVPYFTAQNGQMSVLHLVNTDQAAGKAVKLRWRGAGNADTLLDLTLLLSPNDVWTGTVRAGADGIAQLVTADGSCTQPRLRPGVDQPFSTARLDPAATTAARAANTREGYVEIIAMADIPSERADSPPASSRSPLYTAIKHVNGVAPCTQAALDAALLADIGDEVTAAGLGLATPTGGLVGGWYIIDVPGSTTFSGAATAIQAVNAAGRPARGNFVLFPQTATAVAAPERYTADPLLVSAGLASREKDIDGNTARPTEAAVLTARSSDLPDLSTPYYLPAGALNARLTASDLTKALAVRSIGNQYTTENSISAVTDWVASMPTRRYSVAVDYSADTWREVFSVLPGGPQHFSSDNMVGYNSPMGRQACANADLYLQDPERFVNFDRESSRITNVPFFPESQPPTVAFCGAANVLTFLDSPERSALNASVSHQRVWRGLWINGWARFNLDAPRAPAGLPITGAAFTKLTNPAAKPGVLGHYGITWPHILERP